MRCLLLEADQRRNKNTKSKNSLQSNSQDQKLEKDDLLNTKVFGCHLSCPMSSVGNSLQRILVGKVGSTATK